jgi:hypothetical protein
MTRWAWLCSAAGVVLAASCTTLLGDDFVVVVGATAGQGGTPAGGGSGGGGSGGTGAGGDAGSGGVATFACEWEREQHRIVASLQENEGESWGALEALRRDGSSVRAFALRHTDGGGQLEIITLDGDDGTSVTTPAEGLEDVARLSPSDLGVLYYGPPSATGAPLRLRVIGDADPNGGMAPDAILGDSESLPGYDVAATGLRARMAAVPKGGIDDFAVDVVASYAEGAGVFTIAYGRSDGGPPNGWVAITNPAAPIDGEDAEPLAMIHAAGTSYAFFGDDVVRQYELDRNVDGAVAPRDVAPGTHRLGSIRATAYGYANVFMAAFPGAIQFLSGAIDDGDLGSFGPAELVEVASFATAADLPIKEGGGGWFDDVFLQMGPNEDDGDEMAYYLFDNEGRERGDDGLPFTALLDGNEQRLGIQHVAVALRSETFDEVEGGSFHVVWTEHHERPGQEYEVMYYDVLVCEPE